MTLFQGIDPACQTFVIRFGPFVQPREFVAEAFDGCLEMCAELVANGHEGWARYRAGGHPSSERERKAEFSLVCNERGSKRGRPTKRY